MSDTDLSWMAALCDPEADRPVKRAPFTLLLGRQRLTIATDGHVLVALRSPDPPFPVLGAQTTGAEVVRWVVRQTLEGAVDTDLEAFRTWLGPARSLAELHTALEPFDDDGGGETEADAREAQRILDEWRRPAVVHGCFVARGNLARALEHLPGTRARVAAGTVGGDNRSAVYVDGDGWRALAMGIEPWSRAEVEARIGPVPSWPEEAPGGGEPELFPDAEGAGKAEPPSAQAAGH